MAQRVRDQLRGEIRAEVEATVREQVQAECSQEMDRLRYGIVYVHSARRAPQRAALSPSSTRDLRHLGSDVPKRRVRRRAARSLHLPRCTPACNTGDIVDGGECGAVAHCSTYPRVPSSRRTLAKGKKPMTRADLSPTLSPAEAALRDEVMNREVWLQEAGREVRATQTPRCSLHTHTRRAVDAWGRGCVYGWWCTAAQCPCTEGLESLGSRFVHE